jgi:hypothetical protein
MREAIQKAAERGRSTTPPDETKVPLDRQLKLALDRIRAQMEQK